MHDASLSRRQVIGALGLCGLLGTSACARGRTLDALSSVPRGPKQEPQGAALSEDPAIRLATRLTFGPTESMLALAAGGATAFLDDQLDPSVPDAPEVTALFTAVEDRGVDLLAGADDPDDRAAEAARRRAAIETVVLRTTLRGAWSERQLHAVLADFWTNHLHVSLVEQPTLFLVPQHDMEVVRAHAMGRFRDMLIASARSPAMLVYLDQARSRADGANVPNENYARELLELHTVGIDGGYDETDVLETAHLLSGWSTVPRSGEFAYRPAFHDMGPFDGAADVLGWVPTAGGSVRDGEDFLAHLAALPATSRALAHRLAIRLVGGHVQPDDAVVHQASAAYRESDTSIASMVRSIVGSEAFESAPAAPRRALDLLLAGLRMGTLPPAPEQLDALVAPLGALLRSLGQVPYGWPAPDGYPLDGAHWVAPGAMVTRFSVASAVSSGPAPLRTSGAPDATALLGRRPSAPLAAALAELGEGSLGETGRMLVLASPDFQVR